MAFFCASGGFLAAKWSGMDLSAGECIGTIVFCAVIGGPCGYLAGCLVAGIFLVRERETDDDDEESNAFDSEDQEIEEGDS